MGRDLGKPPTSRLRTETCAGSKHAYPTWSDHRSANPVLKRDGRAGWRGRIGQAASSEAHGNDKQVNKELYR